MTYEIIQPPFSLKFWEMSRPELQGYFDWFQKVLPQRMAILTEVVRESPGFENWPADLSPDSLDALGKWFALHVELRPRTGGEMEKIRSELKFPVETPNEELTEKTFSIAMDIGMYFSQVFLKIHPDFSWVQKFGSKEHFDYGQPLLAGRGKVAMNPVALMVTLAYGLADKSKSGNRLRELYDVWEKMLSKL